MRTIKTWLATIAVLLCSISASAYDFSDYYDGKDMYYNIIDEVNMTAEVTYGSNSYVGNVVIPSTVSRWVSDGESGYNLKSYNVIGIGSKAFQNCTNLYSITIPNSIVYIGENAFTGCNNLDEVHISDLSAWCNIDFTGVSNPLYAGGRPFLVLNGEKVFDLVIPDDVKEIKKLAFHGCSSLQTLSISNSVTTIGKEAFQSCTGLTSITIPKTVTKIEEAAFALCNLQSIVVESGNPKYDSRDNCKAVIETSSNTLIVGSRQSIIPNTVVAIGDYAFAGTRYLNSIEFPKSLVSIGSWAFMDCMELSKITCKNSIPATAKDKYAFYNISSSAGLYVPVGSKNSYANATGWNTIKYIHEYIVEAEKYTITYMVDGEEYYSETIESGAEIPLIDAPTKEGYTFCGWENIPSNMPDEDITVYAKYTPNNYTVSFKANGEIVYSELLTYGTTIVVPDAPEIEDYAFVEWLGLLETVPAHDVEFVAVYKQVGVRIADDANDFTQEGNRAYDKITYTRTLPNLEWNSLFVPFEIPVSDLTDEYDVAYINDIHSYDNDFNGEIDQMEMEVIYIKDGTLHANHPYLIRAKNDEAKGMNIVVTDATLYSSAKADRTSITCSSAYTNFEIIGTYEKMSAQELDGCYAINTSGAWSPIASGASLNPFRLYMTITSRDGSPVKLSQSAHARINIRVQGEDTETGITETENGKVKTENFDLSGRRVERMQKGIYIVNGKKVVR